MKLQESLKELIVEIASVDSVVDCIKKRQKCIIYYDGDEPGGRGLRTIEPVCVGYSKAGNLVLRAWTRKVLLTQQEQVNNRYLGGDYFVSIKY